MTNIFDYVSKVIPNGQATGISDSGNLRFSSAGMASLSDPPVTLAIPSEDNGDYYSYLVRNNGFVVLPNPAGRTSANVFGYGDAKPEVPFSAHGQRATIATNPFLPASTAAN